MELNESSVFRNYAFLNVAYSLIIIIISFKIIIIYIFIYDCIEHLKNVRLYYKSHCEMHDPV